MRSVQFRILEELEHGPLTRRQMAERFGISVPTGRFDHLQGDVTALKSRGLIELMPTLFLRVEGSKPPPASAARQSDIYRVVCESDTGISLQEIADRLGLREMVVRSTLAVLRRSNQIRKDPPDSHRTDFWRLTKAGQQFLRTETPPDVYPVFDGRLERGLSCRLVVELPGDFTGSKVIVKIVK
jgi:predicted ArsR family transcriptional regulator